MTNKHLLLICLVTLLFLSACLGIGINFSGKAPKKAGKYPTFTNADRLRGAITPLRTDYDVHFYDLHIELDVKKRSLGGYVDAHCTVLNATKKIQFDLYPNLYLNKVERLNSNNKTIEVIRFIRKEGAVILQFDQDLEEGENEIIRLHYSGKPTKAKRPPWEGGFVWKKDKDKNPWIGVACEGDGASLWWPLKDHPYDEPDSVGINITVPEGLEVVSNGVLRGEATEKGKTTFNWHVSHSINSYNVTLYAGNFERVVIPYTSLDSSKHDLEFYVLPYNKSKAETHFQHTADIMAFFEEAFGQYPWWRDGFKMVESPYAGMEHQTAIAYGQGYENHLFYDFDYIVLHETAHEWWGNSVTAKDMADLWIHEGFATYAEALYVEDRMGYGAYESYLALYRIFIKNARPVVGPMGVNYFNYKDQDIYMKGAWILHSLRSTINDVEVFMDIIKTFATQNRERIVTSKDFIDLVSQKTGEDYQWFFNQYLYDRKPPRLEYHFDTNTETLQYRWADVADNFKMPANLSTDTEEFVLYPSTEFQTLALPDAIEVNVKSQSFYYHADKVKQIGG